MLAATAGATYASIFFNRVKDAGEDAELVVRQSRALLDRMDNPTKIIVGSIRKPDDVAQAAIAGAHIITIPYKILTQMPFHKKTEETIAEQKQHQFKSIDEYVHWHNEIKPHMSLNWEALETPIQAFQRKQPPKEARTETAEPLMK